jgi:hypothetical protein
MLTAMLTHAVILAAVRRALPGIEIEEHDLDVRDTSPRPHVAVYGDPSWLDRLPPAPAGSRHGSAMVCVYDIGLGVLMVHVDLRARGEA